MAVASPRKHVYYYECSHGRFRLTYFIPPGELQRLRADNRISPQAEKDFPDGVDLDCTEANFRAFKEAYGFRPKKDPDALRRAFYAILSTTRNWKKFYGSGFIPAADLEQHVDAVDGALVQKKLLEMEVEAPRAELSLKQRRKLKHRRAMQMKQAHSVLREMRVKGIDPKRTLSQQEFSRIGMADGTRAEEVFIRLHQKQQEKE